MRLAYGSLYLDQDEDWDKAKSQLWGFGEEEKKHGDLKVYFRVVYKDGQKELAESMRLRILMYLDRYFPQDRASCEAVTTAESFEQDKKMNELKGKMTLQVLNKYGTN